MKNRKIRVVLNSGMSTQRTTTVPVPDNMAGDVCDQSQVKAIAQKTLAAFPALLGRVRGKKLEDGTTTYAGSGELTYAEIAAKIDGSTVLKGSEASA